MPSARSSRACGSRWHSEPPSRRRVRRPVGNPGRRFVATTTRVSLRSTPGYESRLHDGEGGRIVGATPARGVADRSPRRHHARSTQRPVPVAGEPVRGGTGHHAADGAPGPRCGHRRLRAFRGNDQGHARDAAGLPAADVEPVAGHGRGRGAGDGRPGARRRQALRRRAVARRSALRAAEALVPRLFRHAAEIGRDGRRRRRDPGPAALRGAPVRRRHEPGEFLRDQSRSDEARAGDRRREPDRGNGAACSATSPRAASR